MPGPSLPGRRTALLRELDAYDPPTAEEAVAKRRFGRFLRRTDDVFARANLERHVTASALVVDPDVTRTLLHRHAALGMWLQFGGHVEPEDATTREAALRELREETGLPKGALAWHPAGDPLLDLDVHVIPGTPDHPPKEHYDVRYLAVVDPHAPLAPDADAVEALRWFPWEDLGDLDLDAGLRRALGKARALPPVEAPSLR